MVDQYWSTELRIPKSRARALPRSEYLLLIFSRVPIRIASVSNWTEFTGTKIPYSASVTSVHRPRFFPVRISIGPVSQSVATTGQPTPIASMSEFGKPSAFEDETNKRAAAMIVTGKDDAPVQSESRYEPFKRSALISLTQDDQFLVDAR